MRKKRSFKTVFTVCLLSALALAALCLGIRALLSAHRPASDDTAATTPQKTITRDGVDYFPRQDLTVVMLLAEDVDGTAAHVSLLVLDETNATCTVLSPDRNTMLDIRVPGIGGTPDSTVCDRLATACSYGTAPTAGCENMKRTLEQFFHGMTVDHCIALQAEALPLLYQALGLSTDTADLDFARLMEQLSLQPGQLTDYIRLLRDLSPYVVTDISATLLATFPSRYKDFTLAAIVSPEGEAVVTDGHSAFYADAEKLDALTVQLFYAPKNPS